MRNAKTDPKRERREQAKIARQRAIQRRARIRKVRTAAIAVAVVTAVVGLGLVLVRGSSGGVAFAGDLRAGGTLESLKLPALEDSGTVDYSQFSDRPLVINFFASWCPFCVGEMPAFQQVHQELGNRVAFLGISQQDSKGASVDLAHETGITYPAAIDANGVFFNAVGTGGMPTTLFVEPGGRIAYVQVGPLDAAMLKEFIGTYLGVAV